jgi:hypothetical protein
LGWRFGGSYKTASTPLGFPVTNMSMNIPESGCFQFRAQELPHKLRQISKELPTSYWLFEFSDRSETTREDTWHFALSRSHVVFSGNQPISWQWFLECFQRYIPRFRNEFVKATLLELEQQLPLDDPDNQSALLFARLNRLHELNLISPNEARQAGVAE